MRDAREDGVPRALLRMSLGLLLIWIAACPGSPGQTEGTITGAVTIDAAKVDGVSAFQAAWRFALGDGPGYASAAFDDSGWALLGPGQMLAGGGLPGITGRVSWCRLRLHVVRATQPLGITVTARDWQQYAVYANGRKIAESPGMAEGVRMRNLPFAIALPVPLNGSEEDVVLAIRFLAVGPERTEAIPLSRMELGPLNAVVNRTALERLRSFDGRWLTGLITGFLFLAFVPVALTLYYAQRKHTEYLWLGVFFSFGATFTFVANLDDAGLMRETLGHELLYQYAIWGTMMSGLEFISRFSHLRRLGGVRWVQGMMLAMPLLYPAGNTFYGLVLLGGLIAWLLTTTVLLMVAYRKGRAESGLLILPFAFCATVQLLDAAVFFFPKGFAAPKQVHLGHVGFSLDDLSGVVFLAGILAVVLYRFHRVVRDEQAAESELDAARTVQRLLIAEATPSVPGYDITSVYQPARQVSGDFFQVLPLRTGALVVMGEVSGKGLEAAMTVASIVGAVRTMAGYTDAPGEMMTGLNGQLHGRSQGFTTCLILRMTAAGEVTAANAGHLQPYLRGREVGVAVGLPLGVVGDTEYSETAFALLPGERLTLLTDGVVETLRPGSREMFGFARTAAISNESATAIAEAARTFGEHRPLADDLTVLTIAYQG